MVQQPAESPGSPVTARYVYVWEFRVAPEREPEFVAAYGPAGTWAQMFRKAAGYIETLLLQDRSVPGRFLTIDRWSDEAAHERFVAQFRDEYRALDLACEPLTQHETSLGSYWEHIHPEG